MHRSIRTLATCAAVLAAVLPVAAAGPEVNVTGGMTLAGAPLAIHGYDPVAFHTEGAAMPGSARHTAVHDGAAYRFVSAANLEAFGDDPERYLPRYGGFCAYGVALGAKFDGDPRVFAIVDDALYFNLNPDIQATWNEDIAGNVRKADANWTKIRAKSPASLK